MGLTDKHLVYGDDIPQTQAEKDYYWALKNLKEKQQESCEDAVSRQAVLNTLDKMDKALDDDRSVESYKELLTECYKDLTPVTPKEEIIHCKDCKYRDYWGDCNKWSKELDAHKTYLLDENMYCGFAERKG